MTRQRQRLQLTKEQLDEVQNKLKERQLLNIVVNTNQVLVSNQQELQQIDPHEEERLRVVRINAFAIQNMANPSEQVQLEAVRQNAYTVGFIDKPTEKVQLEVINRNISNFQYIKNPTEKVQLEAVKQYGFSILYIENPSEQVQLEAVRQNGNAIQWIKNPSEQVQLEAIRQNRLAIQFIKNPSVQVRLEVDRIGGLRVEAREIAITQVPTVSQVEEIHSKLRERTQNKNIIQLPIEQRVIQGPAEKPKNLIFGDGISSKENAIEKPPTNEEVAKIYSKLNSKKKKEDLKVIAKQAITQANLKDMEEIKKSQNLIEIHTKKIEELEKTVKEFESHIKETELLMTSIMDQVDILEGGIEEIQERIEQRKFEKVV